MSDPVGRLREQYAEAFESHLTAPGEAALSHAYELGRSALNGGLGVLDVAVMHHDALRDLLNAESLAIARTQIEKAAEFFTEILSTFEMSLRGYKESTARLVAMNETLEQQVAERTAALRESERRFQDIAEVSGDWIWETDIEHRFTLLVGQRTDGLLVRPESLIGRTRWERVGADPTTDELWAEHKVDLNARRPFRHFRYEIRSPDGPPMFITASGKPVFDADQKFLGYRGTATDETATVEAQRRADAAEVLLQDAIHVLNRRIFDNSLDLILVTDGRGAFIRVSPSSMSILGYDPDEMIGRSGLDFVYCDDLDAVRAEMRAARRGGMTQNFECRYVHKQGRIVSLWWTGVWSAPAHQFFFIGRDVTDRKESDRLLRERTDALVRTNRQLNAIMDASPLAIFMLDPNGVVVLWTASAERVFGYTEAEALGRFPPYLVDEHMRDFRANIIARAAHDASATGVLGVQRRRKDGSFIDVSAHWARVDDEEGQMIGTMCAVADITEQKQLESQLRQAQKMEAIGNLTGGMAHDFNNLLGIIIGNLDLLRDRQSGDPDADELSREALDAALRGADLTSRLLAFARRQPLQPARTDVNALIAGIVKLLERTLGEQIQITLDLDPNTWPVVVDPAQLESSLTNLATNARDAMPGGGLLRIATGNRPLDADYASRHAELHPGDYAMIELSDSGSGMPPEVASHIFEPFYTTKELGKGTGLSLSMVFGFMKQSSGHINVYSEVGIGTTFRLFLQRAEIDAEAGAAVLPAALVRGGGEIVLAVDDNASLRRVVVRQLTELGYRVLEAQDAPTALRVLESEPIDLLFTDVVMPGGTSGYELARTALSRWPVIKVVLTSGFPQTKINRDANAPSLRLLSKPYRRDDLGRLIRDVLDS